MHKLRYGVVGTGRWGATIADILVNMGRDIRLISLSRRPQVFDKEQYFEYAYAQLSLYTSEVDALWFAVPPGDQELLIRAGIALDCHIIVEKPWAVDLETSQALSKEAQDNGLVTAVHYQYCYLSGLTKLVQRIGPAGPLQFDGIFTIDRSNRLGLEPFGNMASHLLAVQKSHFPQASLGVLYAAYESQNCRQITISAPGDSWSLDFTKNTEPLIQSFIVSFEEHCQAGLPFSLGLTAAGSIMQQIKNFLTRGHWTEESI